MVVQLGFAVSCMHASLKENTSSPLVITEAAALVQIKMEMTMEDSTKGTNTSQITLSGQFQSSPDVATPYVAEMLRRFAKSTWE